MSADKPVLTLSEAQKFLARAIGSAPDSKLLLEWLRMGYLTGEEQGSEVLITESSLQTLAEQLEKVDHRKGARLALHAVDIWRREPHRRAVAVTLSTKSHVITTEQICQDNDAAMMEAAVKATLDAISEAILSPLSLSFRQVKHHSIPNIEQSMVAVLVSAGEGEDVKVLTGVAMAAKSSSIIEAAARATLNALNRTISPFLQEERSWRDIFKKILPSLG